VWLIRLMTRLSLLLGAGSRLLVYGIAAYFFRVVAAAAVRSRDYLRRASGASRDRATATGTSSRSRRRSTIALPAQRPLRPVRYPDAWPEIALRRWRVRGQKRGAFLMGAHMGSFEVIPRARPAGAGVRAVMVMFEENARKITEWSTR
jgi:predicted LPLAT superfamily acyltransferase